MGNKGNGRRGGDSGLIFCNGDSDGDGNGNATTAMIDCHLLHNSDRRIAVITYFSFYIQ